MIFLDMGNRNSILLIGLMVFLVLCSYSCEEGERVERGQVYVPSLDNVIASEIIHDDCGVTAGDGMYSILLPDGRSIFLMGIMQGVPLTTCSETLTISMTMVRSAR